MIEETEGRKINLSFKIKDFDGSFKRLGSKEELLKLCNSKIGVELNYLNKELKLNKLYNFKKEGYIKNECIMKLKEFTNG